MFPPTKKKKKSKSDSPFSGLVRWFTETKQYLVAFAASIAAFGVLQHQIAKIDWTNWVAEIVAIIPPLLVFLFKTLPRLIKEHRGERLVESSKREIVNPRPTITEADYFYIGPYPESRRQRYDRADGVHKEVLSWLKKTKEPVVVLSGLSGTGKTSMLEAFVIPELRESKPSFKMLLIRGFDRPLAELQRQLIDPGVIWKKLPTDLADLALGEIVRRAVSRLRQDDPAATLLAVLDQFEELVTLRETSDRSAVAGVTDFLRDLRNSPIDGFLLLLSVRTDYETFLEPLGVPPLEKSRNWHEVPAFLYSAALTFLRAPQTGLNIHEERLRRVLREAVAADGTRGLIRPIILNMLGVVLQRIADSPEAERPTRTLLIRDLRAVINHPDRQVVARAILPFMLSEADTKQARSIAELCSATKLDAHKIHGCLLQLEASGYVRQISRSPEIMNRVWEVSHDFVARLLGPILRNPFQGFWERFGRVFYPVSAGAWVIAAGSLVFAVPWLDRKAAESQLETTYNFWVKETTQGYVLKEENSEFNDLLAANSYLRKLDPVTLILSICKNLTNVDGLKNLKNLQQLNLTDCESLTSVDALKDLENLQWLDLSDCESLNSVDALKDLKNLQRLDLSRCYNLTSIDGLKDLKNLKWLDLSRCYNLTSIDGLKDLMNLPGLNLASCVRLTSIDGLKDLKNLQQLELTDCESLTSVDALKDLKNLQRLDLSRCYNLTSIDGLKDLKNLQRLDLIDCESLTSVDALKDLKNLQWLDLSGCYNLTSIDGLKDLKNLTWLDLTGCKSLTSVDALKDLKNLQWLKLTGCLQLPADSIVEIHKELARTSILQF